MRQHLALNKQDESEVYREVWGRSVGQETEWIGLGWGYKGQQPGW